MRESVCCWMGRRLSTPRAQMESPLSPREFDSMKSKHARTQSEAARIAELLRRAFGGSAWHGPALLELLEYVDSATAAAKPLSDVHSIWELVLHIAVWD